jgi:predicted nucleotidyltransferase
MKRTAYLQKIVKLLREIVSGAEVILFGSKARGEANVMNEGIRL